MRPPEYAAGQMQDRVPGGTRRRPNARAKLLLAVRAGDLRDRDMGIGGPAACSRQYEMNARMMDRSSTAGTSVATEDARTELAKPFRQSPMAPGRRGGI